MINIFIFVPASLVVTGFYVAYLYAGGTTGPSLISYGLQSYFWMSLTFSITSLLTLIALLVGYTILKNKRNSDSALAGIILLLFGAPFQVGLALWAVQTNNPYQGLVIAIGSLFFYWLRQLALSLEGKVG